MSDKKTSGIDDLQLSQLPMQKHEKFIREILLIKHWIKLEDLIEAGYAKNRQGAYQKLKWFIKNGLLEKSRNRYKCVLDVEKWLSNLFPPLNEIENIKREMKNYFDPVLQEEVISNPLIVGNKIRCPSWYFDVYAINYPVLVTDENLVITHCSKKIEEIAEYKFPNLKQLIKENKLTLYYFLKQLDLYHFDLQSLECTDIHILNKNKEEPGLFEELLSNGTVNKKNVCVKYGNKIKHYLEISVAFKKTFQGVQLTWQIVDERINSMIYLRALRATKWFISSHRLKQPLNLFNASCNYLTLILSEINDEKLREDVKNNVIQYLNMGIKDFTRYVKDASDDELKFSKGLRIEEHIDPLILLKEAAKEVDELYAKPAGVKIETEILEKDYGRYCMKADIFLLKEAFFNLIHNAVVHGGYGVKEGVVKIVYQQKNGGLKISIEDNGKGMSLLDVEKYNYLFKQFKEDPSWEEAGLITGLNLAMLVIKSTGGKLEFENMAKGGLRIRIIFSA